LSAVTRFKQRLLPGLFLWIISKLDLNPLIFSPHISQKKKQNLLKFVIYQLLRLKNKGGFAVTKRTIEVIEFTNCKRRKVHANFGGGEISSKILPGFDSHRQTKARILNHIR
jgi:hypothetical protein